MNERLSAEEAKLISSSKIDINTELVINSLFQNIKIEAAKGKKSLRQNIISEIDANKIRAVLIQKGYTVTWSGDFEECIFNIHW